MAFICGVISAIAAVPFNACEHHRPCLGKEELTRHLFFLSLSLVLLFYGPQYYYKLKHIPLCYAVGFILTPADRSCRPLERLAPSVSCPSLLTPLFSFLPLSPSVSPPSHTHTLTHSLSIFACLRFPRPLFSPSLSLSPRSPRPRPFALFSLSLKRKSPLPVHPRGVQNFIILSLVRSKVEAKERSKEEGRGG